MVMVSGIGDFANEFLFRLIGSLAFQPLDPPTERCDRSFALFVGAECGDQRQAAAVLLSGAARRFRGGGRSPGARAASRPRRLFLIGFERRPSSQGLGVRCFLAEALFRLLLGFELRFQLVLAAALFLSFASLRGITLGALYGFTAFAEQGLLFGNFALFCFAQPGIAQCTGTSRALLVCERTQHNSGRFGRSCWCRSGRRGGRRDRDGRGGGKSAFGRRRSRGRGLSPCSGGYAAFDLLNNDRLAAAMAETLAHHPLLDARVLSG